MNVAMWQLIGIERLWCHGLCWAYESISESVLNSVQSLALYVQKFHASYPSAHSLAK